MNMHDHTPQKKSPRILSLGMPVRDLIFRVQDLPPRGHKEHATAFVELSGGNGLNAAIAIARLGGRALLSGPVGGVQEKTNAYIYDQMAEEGVDVSGLVKMDGMVTPISNIMIDPSGERTIVTYRDPELWTVRLPEPDVLLSDCDAILAENRCADFVMDVCAEAHRRNIPVVVDGDRVMTLKEGLLQVCSHIIFSADALRRSAGEDDETAAMRKVSRLTPAMVGVTSGANGVSWLEADGTPRHMPAFAVTAVDTLGAGDTFHGAFTLAVAEGQTLEQAMRFAQAAAALKCTRFGGGFGSPQRIDVDAFLASHPATQKA